MFLRIRKKKLEEQIENVGQGKFVGGVGGLFGKRERKDLRRCFTSVATPVALFLSTIDVLKALGCTYCPREYGGWVAAITHKKGGKMIAVSSVPRKGKDRGRARDV